MKLIILALGILLFDSHLMADIRPDSSGIPLFKVFKLIQTEPDTYDAGPLAGPTHHWTIDDKHPLLVVYSLDDFLLEADKKSVRVVLNESDAKIFTKVIQEYGVLGITTGETVAIIMSSKPFDGSLTFENPVAGYLRHRFHIAPNTNERESPTKIPAASPPA